MLPFDENLRAKLRKEDLDKKNRKIITSSHAYKKRIHQLERIKTMKRIRRRMETPKEKSYKNERRHMQPLEADEEITTELLSCPFKTLVVYTKDLNVRNVWRTILSKNIRKKRF